MQLAFQCQCYDYGVDRAENCGNKLNCELFSTLSIKPFETIKSTLIVMLPKWFGNWTFDKTVDNKCISMNATPNKQQHIQQTMHGCSSVAMLNYKQISIQLNSIKMCAMGQNCHTTDDQLNDIAFFTQSINYCNNNNSNKQNSNEDSTNDSNCKRFSDSIDQSPHLWSKNMIVPRQSIRSQLLCNKHYVKTYRNDVNGVAEIMHKQRYSNLSSTKIAYDTLTIGTDRANRCTDEQFNTKKIADTAIVRVTTSTTSTLAFAIATATAPITTIIAKHTNGRKTSGKYMLPPAAAKPSLKIVQRSPLTSAHRANLMHIYIKYLLILNCLMCFANGNLMSRNMGNDLSSKHNQSNAELLLTTPLNNSSTSIGNNRKGILTTTSPLIPHSILSSSNRSQFQSPPSQSQESERIKQLLHQHAQEALTSNSYISDEPPGTYKMPNGDDSSEEFSRCTSCQFREQLKAHNLASIKMHILARLSMTHPPNITGRPHISEQILQTFYENNDFRYIRVRNDSIDEMNEMQGDDPNASNGQHQHHHLHEYHRNGGIKTGLHEQHHHHHNRHSR